MRGFASLIVGILALILGGCASRQVSSARLTKQEAVHIAVAAAQKAGAHLDAYQAPRVTFNSMQGQWYILFIQKSGPVGGDIAVSVDDKRGIGTLIPSD